jgi:hypothetical protein
MVLKKAETIYWPRIMRAKGSVPRNVHRWWELWEQYEHEVTQLRKGKKVVEGATAEWWAGYQGSLVFSSTFVLIIIIVATKNASWTHLMVVVR